VSQYHLQQQLPPPQPSPSEIENLERVVIETTGLADPAPILHTLMNEQSLLDHGYGLGAVVTTVDAVNGLDTLDNHQEAVKQAGIADLLLLTKTDLAAVGDVSALQERIKAINPGAKTLQAVDGAVSPTDFFAAGLYRLENETVAVQNWLNAEAYISHSHAHADDHARAHATPHRSLIAAAIVMGSGPIV
jgi:G3E family GTPase